MAAESGRDPAGMSITSLMWIKLGVCQLMGKPCLRANWMKRRRYLDRVLLDRPKRVWYDFEGPIDCTFHYVGYYMGGWMAASAVSESDSVRLTLLSNSPFHGPSVILDSLLVCPGNFCFRRGCCARYDDRHSRLFATEIWRTSVGLWSIETIELRAGANSRR